MTDPQPTIMLPFIPPPTQRLVQHDEIGQTFCKYILKKGFNPALTFVLKISLKQPPNLLIQKA
jgi:hypothetical protein